MSVQNSAGDETFLTVAEVAAILRLNPQTVRNWIDQGTLPAIRMGRRVRIKRSDFDRVVEQSYSGANNGPDAEDFWGGKPVGVADPGVADPGVADPGVADPGVADPGIADLGIADPGIADPGLADPGLADPGVADPGVAATSTADPEELEPGPAAA